MKPAHDAFFLGFIAAALLSGLLLITLYEYRLADMRAEVVKRGAAEWVVNPENGDTQFRWTQPTQEP